MAFPNDLKNDFKTADALDKLEPLSGYDDALHQNQQDDLSTNDPAKVADVKRFFDYMALHVLIPCINALNRAVLALKGNTSTSLEKLEKKLADLSGGTTKSVKALEERVDTVEKASAVSTAKVEAATELAKAAAENVMQKDQCASVMDLITGQPLYLGAGTKDDVDALIPVAPGKTLLFEEDDVDLEELAKAVANKAPAGLVDRRIWVNQAKEEEKDLDIQLKRHYGSMKDGEINHILVLDVDGKSFFTGGNTFLTIYKTTDDYGVITAIKYSGFGIPFEWERLILEGTWHDWGWKNPPMHAGVKYRTTKLWKGLPVYAMLIDFGALPNNDTKNYEIGTGISVFSIKGVSTGGGYTVVLEKLLSEKGLFYNNNTGKIGVTTTSDLSAYADTEIVVKYTKVKES